MTTDIPENTYCTKSHEYITIDGDIAKLGITHYAADQLGEIVYVELPEVDSEFKKGDIFGTIESVKAASELYMPVGGKVVEINDDLTSEPELINEDSYDKGWIIKISNFDKSELEDTLNAADYLNHIEE
ncbi:MAG: glycine cleavage system protein GcvH [Vampirovibrionia bacterium]